MWRFRELTPGEVERCPRESEFFNVGDIDRATALVREVIQNSLDARLLGKDSVRVRFTFGRHKKTDGDNYYDELIPHIDSCGLLPLGYAGGEDVQFLTIEDFGTTGLDGAVGREELKESEGSNYYSFWWCEGKSEKTGPRAGRWGLGKTAFHVASTLRSFWGLTVRHDDHQELLLGKSSISPHRHNGKTYDYLGYFAGDSYAPIEAKEILQGFCSRFAVTRSGEPGLSIVIPAPEPEITADAVIRSVIIHYFFPIISGVLRVEICANSSTVALNASNLREMANKQDWSDSPWRDRDVDTLMEFLEDAVTMREADGISLQTPAGTPKIKEGLFGDKLDQARAIFAAGQLVCLEIPVKIHPKDQPEKNSHFKVYLKKDDELSTPDEFYVRAGITISEIKKLGNRKVRAMLSAQDEAICTFLGDCESPAHTDWKERTEQFRERYHGARDVLRLIKSSMAELVRILDQPTPGLVPDFLEDILFVLETIEDEKKEKEEVVKPVIDIPPRRPQIFELSQITGGFRVSLSGEEVSLPIQARVRMAYDTREGNPFAHYHPMDFQLEDGGIDIAVTGGHIVGKGQNQLKASVDTETFELRVTGFDPNRDLVVETREVG